MSEYSRDAVFCVDWNIYKTLNLFYYTYRHIVSNAQTVIR